MAPFFPAFHIPVGAAIYIKKHLVPQIGPTNANGNNSIRLIVRPLGQFFHVPDFFF